VVSTSVNSTAVAPTVRSRAVTRPPGETPEELHARAAGALRMPPVAEWETFPFDGRLQVRPLEAPVTEEPPRQGAGGDDCSRCARSDDAYLWTDEHWRLGALAEPSGLPVVVLVEPRTHYDFDDLPPELAVELGPLLVRVERAVRSVGGIGRVHVCRWGDGSEHLHWWFLARPERLMQLIGSFAAIWDDILPPLPADLWRANLDAVARAMQRDS
jgi:diadenosine tetraphosphate (Ap4A) HIT family hydrolase